MYKRFPPGGQVGSGISAAAGSRRHDQGGSWDTWDQGGDRSYFNTLVLIHEPLAGVNAHIMSDPLSYA